MGILNEMRRKRQLLDAQTAANKAQADYDSQMERINNQAQRAQGQITNPLESVLSGITSGAQSLWNAVAGVGNEVVGGIQNVNHSRDTGNTMSNDSARRNEIAKKYGYASYSDAANDDNASQDFWNEIKNTTEETANKLKQSKDAYVNSSAYKNLAEMNQNKYAADAIRAENFLADVLTAGGGSMGKMAGLNAVQGALNGLADELENSEGLVIDPLGGNYSFGNLDGDKVVKSMISNALGSAVGSLAGGSLGNVAGKGNIGKIIGSNVGRGALSGAASSAATVGAQTALNGGDLGEVLANALNAGKSGLVTGGITGGVMGVANKGFNKLSDAINNRANRYQAQDAPQAPRKPIIDEVAGQYTKKPQTIETALQEAQTPTRRTIDVQYDDGSNGNVALRRNRSMYSLPDHAGSTLDGILGPNNARQLPNAQKPTYKMSAYDAFNAKGDIEPIDIIRNLDEAGGLSEATMNMLKDEIDDYRYTRANAALQAYGLDNKSELPKLNREQYYKDNMGQLAANGGNGAIRAEDVEDYMYNHLSDEVGKNSLGRQVGDNATILRELIGDRADNMSIDEMYDIYRMLARSDSMANADMYSRDNILNALAGSPELNRRLSQEMYDYSYPGTGIGIKGQTSLAERVDVNTPDRGRLIQDLTPQRRQTQPQVQAQPIQETPTQSVAPRVRRATDMSNIQEAPNLDPADVARLEREITVNRQKQGAALLEQYGDLDNPTRRAVGSAEDVLATLYNSYGLKTPADVQYASNHVTGENGLVSQMTRELASSAKNVDTTITRDWLDDIRTDIGLSDEEYKTVLGQIKSALKRTEKSNDGNTTLDAIRQLEKQSARYKGKDKTYHLSTDPEKRKGMTLDLVRDELQGRLWEAAGDPKKVLTQERLNTLKNMYKGNQTWADFVDNKLAKVRNGAELRATMKPLVDGSTIVNGAKMSAGGFGANMKRLVTSGHPLQAFGQMAYDLAAGSEPAKQARAAKYAGNASNAQAQLEGKAPVQQAKTGLAVKAKNAYSKVDAKLDKATDKFLNSAINTSELPDSTAGNAMRALTAGTQRNAIRNNASTDMRNREAVNALNALEQEAQGAYNTYNNSLLEAQQAYNQAQQALSSGSSTLDRISAAMERALTAGDINAYSQLASLYQEAAKIYQLQNPTATKSEAKALSSTQSKAMTGLQQLQGLRGMQPGVRTALANTPLASLVDLTGGDSYANQAKSLALTLGYLQSGANITPREAENIGRAYIPSAYDSEQERQNKLSRAEQLLRNYLADTSALESIQ